jgi:hypothetical protein
MIHGSAKIFAEEEQLPPLWGLASQQTNGKVQMMHVLCAC